MTEPWRTRELPLVTLKEAAAALGVTPGSLRLAEMRVRNGELSKSSLAGRLVLEKVGRDLYASRDALLAELDRRRAR